mmetsp:Transcript_21854/g.70601  ORF Transcript_21854/g.70601 Transcript_21854/m.70601 type:complete len:376 (+) Transcript_21854:1666-2793(+)
MSTWRSSAGPAAGTDAAASSSSNTCPHARMSASTTPSSSRDSTASYARRTAGKSIESESNVKPGGAAGTAPIEFPPTGRNDIADGATEPRVFDTTGESEALSRNDELKASADAKTPSIVSSTGENSRVRRASSAVARKASRSSGDSAEPDASFRANAAASFTPTPLLTRSAKCRCRAKRKASLVADKSDSEVHPTTTGSSFSPCVSVEPMRDIADEESFGAREASPASSCLIIERRICIWHASSRRFVPSPLSVSLTPFICSYPNPAACASSERYRVQIVLRLIKHPPVTVQLALPSTQLRQHFLREGFLCLHALLLRAGEFLRVHLKKAVLRGHQRGRRPPPSRLLLKASTPEPNDQDSECVLQRCMTSSFCSD